MHWVWRSLTHFKRLPKIKVVGGDPRSEEGQQQGRGKLATPAGPSGPRPGASGFQAEPLSAGILAPPSASWMERAGIGGLHPTLYTWQPQDHRS